MRRRVGWTALVVASALACAGCADAAPDLDADRARTLQESVLAVTQAAAESRWSDAQGLVAQTREALDQGADAGEVSTARYRQIDAALDGVESDLAAAVAAAAVAAEAAAEQAAADQAAAELAATPQPALAPEVPAKTPKGKENNPGKPKGGK
ncbi:mucin-associated surface protein [uncultured Cellulomonas sp.]|uniref:mucin-associated surface protein n=1 Tax=uncultured Cellulomonas sp. TaxID=189682 RepID=UPI0028EAB711|nr:mucin-associated surface protein [uncultured Cellulomonas sp.]